MHFLCRTSSVAIQGFGNAGANMADIIAREGYKVVAASDSRGAVYNPKGLDIGQLMKYKDKYCYNP